MLIHQLSRKAALLLKIKEISEVFEEHSWNLPKAIGIETWFRYLNRWPYLKSHMKLILTDLKYALDVDIGLLVLDKI